jgi:transposase-like protein
VDETYVEVAGMWRYAYRAVDQFGQVIDVYLSRRRDLTAARRFFEVAVRDHGRPAEVVTDKAPSLLHVVDELMPDARHDTEPFARTTASKATTLVSRLGCDPCVACDSTGTRRW